MRWKLLGFRLRRWVGGPTVGAYGESGSQAANMARRQREREAGGPAKAPVKASARVSPPRAVETPAAGLEAKLKAVERDRDAIKAALAVAETRIKDLENHQSDVANRIAWALDSLHNLLEEKT